ncbi:dynein heavy chain, cytoplasmic [Rhizoctonia solani]|uniref:Dynein heavy chain, cytoplasmic n=1 Tax=Rhizoctonia solani TaxID=456999 RepID=A0A8H8PBF7_9AGAM|nr:dynein heavy chain, cytoplasmic [Rhizoctonia solani]QRW27158.1 dynein heavy chain, cytoplasmic [Rhizoctonia solani]
MASGLDTPELYTNGTNGTPVLNSDAALPIPPAPASSFDPAQFRTYLLALLPPVIGATVDEIEATLFDSEFDEKLTRFAAEGVEAIYIVKTRAGEPEEDATPTYSYTLTQQLQYNSSNVTTLALIKRTPTLDTLLPLAPQLHILNLFGGDETPYESLHAVVSQAVKPWFDAFVGARGSGKDGDGKMGIPVTKKKFAELELSLLHLQQNVEIPETHLIIHPSIQKAVDHAHATNTPVHIDLIPGSTLSDSSFLNTLQAHVNTWIKSIQGVTKLTRDVSSGTASQEINFWLSLERALEGIETQLRGDEVQLVMECLRNAKRFRATVSFIADTGLKEATDIVHKYNQLMKEFPLNELLSATDLDKIHDALYQVFGHINRKLRLSPYPIRRALPLVEAISRDFNDQLLRVLTSHRLTYAPYETFDRLLKQTQEIFRAWDDLIKEFTNVAREVTRRRSEKFIPIKVQPAHAKLMERTRYLRDWRKQHEQLAVMTGPTKGLGGIGKDVGGMDMEEEVKEAYEIVKGIDVLDVSTEGTEIWVTAENAYNERVARVENQIISRLRDRLGTARNANEMFRVFSKFNALFVRPKIRGAIQEYQTQLIESVKEDIKRLHDKFKTQYRYSDTYHMSQMRDLPPIAGAIIWARQIERQLNTYMTRVQDVLGKSWELYAEGQKLQAESTSFRKKLDTRPVYEAWLHDINRRDMNINGRLFEIIRLRGGGFQLTVNFDPQIITLFKEVRNLLWLGFQVPHTTSNLAKDAKRVYPHAVSLMETVRTYAQTLDLVEANKGIEMLVAEYRNEVQRMITRGMALRWDFFVNTYDSHRFHGYANLDNWVAELDAKIEALLLVRLTHIIQLWCTEFDRTEEDEPRREAIEGNLTLKPIVHEIRIQNQVIFLDPPIEYARGIWIRQLHSWLGVVCGLRRIQSSRYEIGLQMQGAMVVDTTYTGLLTRLNESTLVRPFDLVETKVQQVKEYVAKWLQFQSLWDLEAEYVFTRLGDSLANWQQLLTEIKRTRQTFDNSDTQRSFGVCVIDYEQVQARVNAKYDSWQRDILQRFGVKLANEMKEMHAAITKARHDMEQQSMRF